MKNKKGVFFSIRSVSWSKKNERLIQDFWRLNSWDWPYWWLGDMFLRHNREKKKKSMRIKQICRWWRNIRAGQTGWTSVFPGMVMRGKETRAIMVSEEHRLWQSILNASSAQSICKEAAKVATAQHSVKKLKWLQHTQHAFVNQQRVEVVPSTVTWRSMRQGAGKQRLSE